MSEGPNGSKPCSVRKINDEVLYAAESAPAVAMVDVRSLEEKGALNPRRTIRLCTHRDIEDPLHEMFIVHSRGTYVPPHKHRNKVESSHVIEGRMDIVLFDDAGNIMRVVRLGDFASGLPFYFRLAEPVYHTMLMRTDRVVFHEITTGPFRKEDCLFAPFAPAATDRAAQLRFIEELSAKIGDVGGA